MYYITICVNDGTHRFGEVENAEMCHNEAGRMVEGVWQDLPSRFPNVTLDEFIVMPNHLHGIFCIAPADRIGEITVGTIVGAFKSILTVDYIRGVKAGRCPPFHKQLLQRNFFEHIISDEVELDRIREYIIDNPARWQFDRGHPEATGM